MSILPFTTKSKRNGPWPRPAWRLFCFPYAGGSASAIYRSWHESLPASTELFPVQLPGRGERAAEAPISRLADLIPQLAKELSPFFEVPFAFYGHSMGALIAFELARHLERSGGSKLSHLFASSCAAPCLARTEPALHQLPDAALLCRLDRLQGTPPEVLDHPELVKKALALFRADLALCETYLYAPGEPLDCPISVFGGLQDPIVSLASLERWRDTTRGECRLNMFEGNHFFIKQARPSLLETVSSRLFTQGRREAAHAKQRLAAIRKDLLMQQKTIGEGEDMQNWCGNLTEFLFLNVQKIGRLDSPAIQTENERLNYRELFQNVNRAGNVFKAVGIKPGDRILLVMHDSPLLVYAFLGAIRIGAIPAIVNTMLLQREYADYAADSRARLCLVDQVLMEKVESCRGELDVFGAAEFATALEGSSDRADFHACSQMEPAFWQYSSGSTGRPKAVIHSHRGPIEVANRYGGEILRINSDDRCFSTSRMFFGYGLGNSLLFPLMAGALSILVSETVTPEKVSQMIETFRPTLLFSVPSFYVRMLSHLKESGTDLSSVRLSVSAGEALPSATYEEWLSATGIELLDGIGSTEALHIFISNRAGQVRPGSCGRPLAEVEVMLVDKRGEPVQEGDSGKLMVRYPGLALGYWQRPELDEETFVEGWLDTRDIFRRDESGYFWHMGRSDDMFKVKGMWVSPVEVEDCLHSHPFVRDCAVIGQQNGSGLTEVAAYLVLNASATGSDLTEEFHAYLEQNLVRHKIPTRFHYVDIIPRTTTGKKKRFELTAAFAAYA